MIITRTYARRLVAHGDARILGLVNVGSPPDPVLYIGIERLELQRTDHVMGELADAIDYYAGREVHTLDPRR